MLFYIGSKGTEDLVESLSPFDVCSISNSFVRTWIIVHQVIRQDSPFFIFLDDSITIKLRTIQGSCDIIRGFWFNCNPPKEGNALGHGCEMIEKG